MTETLQLFEALPEEEFTRLKTSIADRGLLVPITTDQHGTILDGYHRHKACEELGIAPRYEIVRCVDNTDRQIRALVMNLVRRQLTREQKARAVQQLRDLGYTLQDVAKETGMSVGTVHGLNFTSENEATPPTITNTRGQTRPTKYKPRKRKPAPVVYAKTPQEATRAQQALAQLGEEAPATVMDVRRVERVAREHEAARRREAPLPVSSMPETIRMVHGDFREVLLATLGTAKVDAIITDPPYHREALPLLADLSRIAAQILHPRGILAALVGQSYLAESLAALATHLEYRWTGCYLTQGQRTRLQQRQVATAWKPVLLYMWRGSERLRWVNDDVFVATGDEKTHHPWGQNYDGIAAMVERLTEPGDLVVDPFLGGGTTALACHTLGRRFVGCDSDGAAFQTAWERLYEHA